MQARGVSSPPMRACAPGAHASSTQRSRNSAHSWAQPHGLLLMLLVAYTLHGWAQADAAAGATAAAGSMSLPFHHPRHTNITGIPSIPPAGELLPQLWDPVPVCATVLSKLGQADVEGLRDSMQALQQMTRRVRELEKEEHYVMHREQYKEEKEHHAFKNKQGLDAASITRLLNRARRHRDSASQRVDAAMHALKHAGAIPASMQPQEVAACVVNRLNRELSGMTVGSPPRPLVSFMLQYFKRAHNIGPIVKNTVGACMAIHPVELLVNVDHPQDIAIWAELSYNTSGAVVPVLSGNIHEARAYNRLAAMARGKYLVLIQDDEAMPPNCSWMRDLVTLYDTWPQLGVLGLRTYQLNLLGGNPHDNRDRLFKDPHTGIDFLFAMVSDYAPFAVRKSAYLQVGGVDETMSDPGKCGIWSDFELCVRMWAAGWQVGFLRVDNRVHDGKEGSTHRPEAVGGCWGRQMWLGKSVYEDRFTPDFTEALAHHVKALNLAHLKPQFTTCPWGPNSGGCPPGLIPSKPA